MEVQVRVWGCSKEAEVSSDRACIGGCLEEVSCRQRGSHDGAPVERTGMAGTSDVSGMETAGLVTWERVTGERVGKD